MDLPHETLVHVAKGLIERFDEDKEEWDGTGLDDLKAYLGLNKGLSEALLEAFCASMALTFCYDAGRGRGRGDFLIKWLLKSLWQPGRYVRNLSFEMELDGRYDYDLESSLSQVARARVGLTSVDASVTATKRDTNLLGTICGLCHLPLRRLRTGGGGHNRSLVDIKQLMSWISDLKVPRLELRHLALVPFPPDCLPAFQGLQELELVEAYFPVDQYAIILQSLPQLRSLTINYCSGAHIYPELIASLPSSLRKLSISVSAMDRDGSDDGIEGAAELCFAKIKNFQALRTFAWQNSMEEDPATFEDLLTCLPASLCDLSLLPAPFMYEPYAKLLGKRLQADRKWLPALRTIRLTVLPRFDDDGLWDSKPPKMKALQVACGRRGIALDLGRFVNKGMEDLARVRFQSAHFLAC
jgi:hypothetical protein